MTEDTEEAVRGGSGTDANANSTVEFPPTLGKVIVGESYESLKMTATTVRKKSRQLKVRRCRRSVL